MKAIVHIGTPKTGTTTIQDFCSANRKKLKSQRIFVPANGNDDNGCHIFALFHNFVSRDAFSRTPWSNYSCDVDSCLAQKQIKRITNQIHYHRFLGMNSVFLSSEGMIQLDAEGIARLKMWLGTLFDEVEILVYLRRQPELFVSLYSQMAKMVLLGNRTFERFCDEYFDKSPEFRYDDYEMLLNRWGDVFGKDKIKPRLFDRSKMFNNDLISDFLHVLEEIYGPTDGTVDFSPSGYTHVKSLNESADAETTEFLRLLSGNLESLENKDKAKVWQMLVPIVEAQLGKHGNKGYHLSRGQVEAILKKYEQSNNTVAKEYFGCDHLFNDDVSMYAENAKPHDLIVEKSAEIFAALLKHFVDEIGRYEKIERSTLSAKVSRMFKKLERLKYRVSTIFPGRVRFSKSQ